MAAQTYTVKEASEVYGISIQTLWGLMHDTESWTTEPDRPRDLRYPICNIDEAVTAWRAMQAKRVRSLYRGVYWDKRRRQWYTALQYQRKPSWRGMFASEGDAAHAYDALARAVLGEAAKLNFPDEAINEYSRESIRLDRYVLSGVS